MHRSHKIRILPASVMVSLSQVKESKGRFIPLWVLVQKPNHTEESCRAGPQHPGRPSSWASQGAGPCLRLPLWREGSWQASGSTAQPRKPDLQRGGAWQGAGRELPEHLGRPVAPALSSLPGTPPATALEVRVLFIDTEPDPQRRGELRSDREGARFSTVYWAGPFGVQPWRGLWEPENGSATGDQVK